MAGFGKTIRHYLNSFYCRPKKMENTVRKLEPKEMYSEEPQTLAYFLAHIIREKRIFLSVAICILVLGVLYSVFTPRHYEAQVAIDVVVPSSGDNKQLAGLVRSIDELEYYLIEKYDIENKRKSSRSTPHISSVRRVGNVLLITSTAREPEEAYRYLTRVLDDFMGANSSSLDEVIEIQRSHISQQEAQSESLKNTLESLSKSTNTQQNPAMAELMAMRRTELSEQLIKAEAQVFNNKIQLVSLQSSGIKVVRNPQLLNSANSTRPNLRIVAIVTALLAVFLGCLAVFFKGIALSVRGILNSEK